MVAGVPGALVIDPRFRGPPRSDSTYVVTAWPVERDGRKLHTGSALFSAEGDLCAVARALWIELRPPTAESG